MLKKEIRVIGIDDAPFDKFGKGNVMVVGTVFRGGQWLDGVLSTKVSIDGNNATAKIAEMINKSKFKPQLQCIFLDGIAVGGFNVIDVKHLSKKTEVSDANCGIVNSHAGTGTSISNFILRRH